MSERTHIATFNRGHSAIRMLKVGNHHIQLCELGYNFLVYSTGSEDLDL